MTKTRILQKDVSKKKSAAKAVVLHNMMEPDLSMVDSLHKQSVEQNTKQTSCSGHKCLGSLMVDVAGFPNKQPRSREDTLVQAKDFLHQFYEATNSLDSQEYELRQKDVVCSINKTGTYDMTYEEICFASKTAWRNAPRCIGRISWTRLEVFDCRNVTSTKEMFDSILSHLKFATNGGNIRSAITIFPPRKPGTTNCDYKIWNPLMIGYAGYKQPDGSVIGDPKSVELTEIAEKLGWKGPGGRFDVLPLILQANGNDPDVFEIPPEYVLEVNFKHPMYPKFDELGLKWYGVPGVANMLADFGGIEFTASAFNGWYMSTEVATRDLCDTGRYNVMEEAAATFDIPVGGNTTLWKDRVCLEINVAVLDSFNKCGVTITDHHSASESFMKHMANEQKLRGGCPADWVWIVPPMSGSLTQVFHQEMMNYKLRPSYEYQEVAWRLHKWKLDKNIALFGRNDRIHTLLGVAKAVLFASIMTRRMLAKRTRCTILYATETGRSQMFAFKLQQIFRYAFNANVYCMDEYDLTELRNEKLLLAVVATTGNGDPPGNAEEFSENASKCVTSIQKGPATPKLRLYSPGGFMCFSPRYKMQLSPYLSPAGQPQRPPLKNSKYSVFGLGSRAYPNFCHFAHTVNDFLLDLGGTCLYPVGEGCEIEGQEEPFKEWATVVFKEACKAYKVDDVTMKEGTSCLGNIDKSWKPGKFEIVTLEEREPCLINGLQVLHGTMIKTCTMKKRLHLQPESSDRQTILVCFEHDCSSHFDYVPGDHIGVFPANESATVQTIINKLTDSLPVHQTFTIDIHEEKANGQIQRSRLKQLPPTTIKQALTYFLDITTPPNQKLLAQLVQLAGSKTDQDKLQSLSKCSKEYQEWKDYYFPNIAEIFDLFPSVNIPASLLLTQLPVMQQRYYSISSSSKKSPNQVHVTAAVVKYNTQDGQGPEHHGVCSTYLNSISEGEPVPCYIRSSVGFHMPRDKEAPIIMVGPGTGIAPFRSFWQQRLMDMKQYPGKKFGPMYLYFGCRTSEDHVYKEDMMEFMDAGVITELYTALSREPSKPKKYVQNYLLENKQAVYDLMTRHGGHFYVCGAVTMATDVNSVFLEILKDVGNMSDDNATNYCARMKSEQRYHEDIFGAGFGGSSSSQTNLPTFEVQTDSKIKIIVN